MHFCYITPISTIFPPYITYVDPLLSLYPLFTICHIVGESIDANNFPLLFFRLDLPTIPRIIPKSFNATVAPDASEHPPTRGRHFLWRTWGHKEPPIRSPESLFHQNATRAPAWQRRSRHRRHANSGGGGGGGGSGGWGHGHLMRVGCVLGTCQVQNLSHRLYQLIGQSGREDSSPINPRSPHSYG
uniref:Adrenomedullin 2b n=1 Tax=Gouania willdenowi TaxID=441366 RepID=A0A8C5DV60_GOUWI